MTDRTLNLRIITDDLPSLRFQAFCTKDGADHYTLFLNGPEEDPSTIASFVHELLHLYHRDHESGLPVAEIEAARRKEIIDVLDALRTRDD